MLFLKRVASRRHSRPDAYGVEGNIGFARDIESAALDDKDSAGASKVRTADAVVDEACDQERTKCTHGLA